MNTLAPKGKDHVGEKSEGHEHHGEEQDHRDHEDHEEGGRKLGEGKAIVELDEQKGFQLSPEAYQALKIDHRPIGKAPFSHPEIVPS